MLTILLATHNGAKTLPAVLDSYLRMETNSIDWKVVIVDNASSDGTSDLLKTYKDRLPLLALRTERRGKNIALNIGLAHVDGDLVVLTDDDAVPESNWLVGMRSAADENVGFDIFGGRIDPMWPDGTEDWVPRLTNLGATYGITPHGLDSGTVSAAQIWGANMAIRRRVFDEGHRFDESVGPAQGQYIMGSETEFTIRLERLGFKAWFVAEAIVGHIIRENQIQREWIIQRAYRLGRHMFHLESSAANDKTPMWNGAPRWKYRRLLDAWILRLKSHLTGDFDDRFRADWEISFLKGYLYEASRQR